VLCDFGEARLGEYDNMADIQPYQYRAPEVILDIPWDEKVDIWNVGVIVSTTAIYMTINTDNSIVDLGPMWEQKFVLHHWRSRGKTGQCLSPRAYDRLAGATSKGIS
jgi:serine/threonine protein kinase